MALTLRELSAAPSRPAGRPRRPLRDNPVLILLWILILLGALAGMTALANHVMGRRTTPMISFRIIKYPG